MDTLNMNKFQQRAYALWTKNLPEAERLSREILTEIVANRKPSPQPKTAFTFNGEGYTLQSWEGVNAVYVKDDQWRLENWRYSPLDVRKQVADEYETLQTIHEALQLLEIPTLLV